jgi:hypothetical protein
MDMAILCKYNAISNIRYITIKLNITIVHFYLLRHNENLSPRIIKVGNKNCQLSSEMKYE